MDHVRGGPIQAQTNDKIEPWHQTLKNNILLENECPPGELEQKFGDFVAHYNHLRYHESINQPDTGRGLLSVAVRQSFWKEKGSNVAPSEPEACNTAARLLNI